MWCRVLRVVTKDKTTERITSDTIKLSNDCLAVSSFQTRYSLERSHARAKWRRVHIVETRSDRSMIGRGYALCCVWWYRTTESINNTNDERNSE